MKRRKYQHFIVEYPNDMIVETDSWIHAFKSFFEKAGNALGVWGLTNSKNPNYETVLWKG